MRRSVAAVACAVALAGCGGGGGDDGNTTGVGNPVFTALKAAPEVMVLRPQQTKTITPRAVDQRGNTIASASGFTYTSSNTAIATVTSSGVVTGVANGTITVAVALTLDNVTKGTNVSVRVTDQPAPAAANVVANTTSDTFSPAVVEVATGGTVTWQFGSVVHNVLFDAITGAPTRIPDSANTNVARTFTIEGTFDYQCTLHAGMTGTVIVR